MFKSAVYTCGHALLRLNKMLDQDFQFKASCSKSYYKSSPGQEISVFSVYFSLFSIKLACQMFFVVSRQIFLTGFFCFRGKLLILKQQLVQLRNQSRRKKRLLPVRISHQQVLLHPRILRQQLILYKRPITRLRRAIPRKLQPNQVS